MIQCYMGNSCGKYFVLGLLVLALILYVISSVTSLFIVSPFEYLGYNRIQKFHLRYMIGNLVLR